MRCWIFLTFLLAPFLTSGQTVFGSDSLRTDGSVFYQELLYGISGQDSLMLDWYPRTDSLPGPTVVFVHGGGFYLGAHRNEGIVYFCDSLRNLGYQVASIGYKLHLKGQNFHCEQPVPNKVKAVETAALDLIRALGFLEASQERLELDMDRIALVGSSAGAEAVLQAMYAPREGPAPGTFGVDAVVSLAGAVADTTWMTVENTVPTMMFHGTCDPLVPFATDIHHYCPENSPGAWLLHGSWSMREQLQRLGVSSYLHVECGGVHDLSGRPMQENIPEIGTFLRQILIEGCEVQSTVIVPGAQDCMFFDCPLCSKNKR